MRSLEMTLKLEYLGTPLLVSEERSVNFFLLYINKNMSKW